MEKEPNVLAELTEEQRDECNEAVSTEEILLVNSANFRRSFNCSISIATSTSTITN